MPTRKKSVAIASRQTAPAKKGKAVASPVKAIGIGKTTKPKNPKTLNLALQGGGSHGAFTWGVLDRLLEEERLDIEGISGTSAGAMNAAIFAQGYAKGGRQGAKAELDRFWHKVAELARFSPVHRTALNHVLGTWNIDGSPGSLWLDLLERGCSPYQLNPMNLNPLRDLLAAPLGLAAHQRCDPPKIFIRATNGEACHARLFIPHS